MAYWGAATILNCVTRNEHLTAGIDKDVMIEAIKAMKVVRQTIMLTRSDKEAISRERRIDEQKKLIRSCMVSEENCNRCMSVCPLRLL